jgi:hypothetical protein
VPVFSINKDIIFCKLHNYVQHIAFEQHPCPCTKFTIKGLQFIGMIPFMISYKTLNSAKTAKV